MHLDPLRIKLLKKYLHILHDQKDFINWDLDLEICQSPAGYYLGMMEEGQPYARFSTQYWPSEAEAIAAINNGDVLLRFWL